LKSICKMSSGTSDLTEGVALQTFFGDGKKCERKDPRWSHTTDSEC